MCVRCALSAIDLRRMVRASSARCRRALNAVISQASAKSVSQVTISIPSLSYVHLARALARSAQVPISVPSVTQTSTSTFTHRVATVSAMPDAAGSAQWKLQRSTTLGFVSVEANS